MRFHDFFLFLDIICGIFCQIETIDVAVEEFSEAEKNLKKSLEHLEQVSSKEFKVLSLLKALNQLGILWCVRDDYQEAKTFLDKSLEEYNIFSSIQFVWAVRSVQDWERHSQT